MLMKKRNTLFTLILMSLWLAASAQAPQSFAYQAVATDGMGNELVEQEINVRASIHEGSATGQVIWEETHDPTTDVFGLFVLKVGAGIRTGGVFSSFSDIQWGTTDYFLQIEMDPAGGANYINMGTTQLLSVPYALHAEKSFKADSASFATTAAVSLNSLNDNDPDPMNEIQELTYDPNTGELGLSGTSGTGASVTINSEDDDPDPTNELQHLNYEDGVLSISGLDGSDGEIDLTMESYGGPGASFDFPQGVLGKTVLILDDFNVPQDKVLYITSGSRGIGLPGYGQTDHPVTPNMPILGPGQRVENCICTGILMDTTSSIEPVIIRLDGGAPYTVETGKVLYIKSGLPYDNQAILNVNNIQFEFYRPNDVRGTLIINFPPGTRLSKPSAVLEPIVVTGYYVKQM